MIFIGSFSYQKLGIYGEMFKNYYFIISTQLIPQNKTKYINFKNEIIDKMGNYYISIPVKMEICSLGEIYGVYDNMYNKINKI